MPKVNLKPNTVLMRPRITEKAAIAADKNNVYVFEVASSATKPAVAASVKEAYKVTPVQVRIVNLPARQVFRRGKLGTKSAVKKAYVYLKKGDKIELL
jgi:large subunit ribosomal protein L23